MDAVLMRVRFVPLLNGAVLRVFAYLVAYPFEAGASADVVECKGQRMLTASTEGAAMALAASVAFRQTAVGYVGASDGLEQLREHGYLKRSRRSRATCARRQTLGTTPSTAGCGVKKQTPASVSMCAANGRAWDIPQKNLAAYRPKRGEPASSVSLDVLALARFGLRAANDPTHRRHSALVDALLRVDFGEACAWRRYTGDDYGETDDGVPY